MDADGSNVVNLTNNNATDDATPAWSPDGSKIAFRRGCVSSLTCPMFPSGIYVMNADGSNPVNLTNNARDVWPTWALVR